MLVLLVPQTKLSVVRGPTLVAPPAFDLIAVGEAVVQVVTDAIAVEGTTATIRHPDGN